MGDIQYWDDTLLTELEQVQTILNKICHYPSDSMERQSAITNADTILKHALQTKRSYKMEARLVVDPKLKIRYDNKLNKHENVFNKVSSDIQRIKEDDKRNELFFDVETGTKVDQYDSDALISDMHRVQDKTQTSLTRSTELIEESKNIGTTTLTELTNQREQIECVNKDMDRIEDELTRADRLIKTFAKRIATDKLFQCFSCVNSLLFLFVIIYTMIIRFKKKSGDEESDNIDTI